MQTFLNSTFLLFLTTITKYKKSRKQFSKTFNIFSNKIFNFSIKFFDKSCFKNVEIKKTIKSKLKLEKKDQRNESLQGNLFL